MTLYEIAKKAVPFEEEETITKENIKIKIFGRESKDPIFAFVYSGNIVRQIKLAVHFEDGEFIEYVPTQDDLTAMDWNFT